LADSVVEPFPGPMARLVRGASIALLAALAATVSAADTERLRILSWNVSGEYFMAESEAFEGLLRWADPNIVLLDEVPPSVDTDALIQALKDVRPDASEGWNVSVGASGGRQRGLVASRAPLETLVRFSTPIAYPAEAKARILDWMTPGERANKALSMDDGIPVHAVLVHAEEGTLLAVVADLQCCGGGPDSWQEYRRRVEAREIRRLIRQVLERESVDGVVFAGDFNLVNSTFPMSILTGAYPSPHSGLIPAEAYHADGVTTWTWDGRETPFPSNTLDYQLYGPNGLSYQSGLVLDTESLSAEARDANDLDLDTSMRTGRHRPVLVEYRWVR